MVPTTESAASFKADLFFTNLVEQALQPSDLRFRFADVFTQSRFDAWIIFNARFLRTHDRKGLIFHRVCVLQAGDVEVLKPWEVFQFLMPFVFDEPTRLWVKRPPTGAASLLGKAA